MKRALTLIITCLLAIGLSACGNKSETTDLEETLPVESTEDPFSLGGIEIDVDSSQQPTQETEPATEVEVLETYSDGSKTSLYSDGSIRNTSNIDNLPEVDKLTEAESLTLQTIVATWDEQSNLSQDYLRENITTNNFPSLSDTDCQRIREKIQKEKPHSSEETEAYTTEETTLATDESQVYLTEEEYMQQFENMSDEEVRRLIEEVTGGDVGDPSKTTVDLEAAKNLDLQG